MQFMDFISNAQNMTYNSSCPKDCEFKSRKGIPIVGVPGPQKQNNLLGVIISRDPTTAFIDLYMEARQKSPQDWHNQLMMAKAPPQWLIRQIEIYRSKYPNNISDADIERLKEVMLNNVYWTHLNKCCTDKLSKEAPKFNAKTAMLCADQWLRQELSDAISQGAEFVICLGNDARVWVSEWKKEPVAKDVQVIYLPHPSRAANGAWNPKKKKKMKELKSGIENLIGLCTQLD